MKKNNNRNYFVVIDQSAEMWTAVKFAIRRAKITKSNITTVSFIQSASEGMMLTSGAEKILDKDQVITEKLKHKEVHNFISDKSKIKAKSSSPIQSNPVNNDKTSIRLKSKRGRFKSLLLDANFEPAKNLSLEELTDETCKYMEGNPNEKDASFCGRKNVEKFSYCPLHLMIVFQPKGKKDEIVDKNDEVPKFLEKKIKSA